MLGEDPVVLEGVLDVGGAAAVASPAVASVAGCASGVAADSSVS